MGKPNPQRVNRMPGATGMVLWNTIAPVTLPSGPGALAREGGPDKGDHRDHGLRQGRVHRPGPRIPVALVKMLAASRIAAREIDSCKSVNAETFLFPNLYAPFGPSVLDYPPKRRTGPDAE